MLWLATRPDGVVKFDRRRREFTRYRNDPGNPASLSSDSVALSLVEDREGGIWVGTGRRRREPVFQRAIAVHHLSERTRQSEQPGSELRPLGA